MTILARYFNDLTDPTQVLDISGNIRVPGLTLTTHAEEGSVAISSIEVDDPNGTLDFVGMRRIFFAETSESPQNSVFWTGFLADVTVSRGPAVGIDSDTFVVGSSARRWTLNLTDVNSLLSRKVITSGNRPAETDIVRVNWLLSSGNLGPVGNTAGYIATSGGVSMDANDYTGQTAYDVLNDCAQHSGRNWFCAYDEGTDTSPSTYIGAYTLFYDFATSSTYSSSARLTNVTADVDDSTTFIVMNDAELRRDPSRIYDGVYLAHNGGAVYEQNTAIGNTYFGSDYSRDAVMPNANVSSHATASALARRYLNDAGSPDDRISARFIVPKEKVNVLKEGQRCQVKLTHFPDYGSDYVYARCLTRTVTQLSDVKYEITVELSPCAPGHFGALETYDSAEAPGADPTFPSITPAQGTIRLLIATAGVLDERRPYTWPSGFTEVGTVGVPFGSPDGFGISGLAYRLVNPASGSYNGVLDWTGGGPGSGTSLLQMWAFEYDNAALELVQFAVGSSANGKATFASAPTPGNLMVAYTSSITVHSSTVTNSGWTSITEGYAALGMKSYGFGYKIAAAGEPTLVEMAVAEWVIIAEFAGAGVCG